MLLALFLGIYSFYATAFAEVDAASNVPVVFLTQRGSIPLKTWDSASLKKIARRSEISAQKLIFDESAQTLALNDRADIDVVTFYGTNRTARVPRFMIWRGSLKLKLNKDGTLESEGSSNRLLVPSFLFSVSKISKIELARISFLYPETELKLRTNPAASRGEKLFTQSCLACHGLPSAPKLKVEELTDLQLNSFGATHKTQGALSLDAKALRGLIAYRDALVVEHSLVKSKP